MIDIADDQIQSASTEVSDPGAIRYGADARGIPAGHADVYRILSAMRQVENSGSYDTTPSKDMGQGAYQFEPKTWESWSTAYAKKMGVGKGPLPMTKQYQDAVAKDKVEGWLTEGHSPKEIASMWNSGHPDWEGRTGVNKFGVHYDVPRHVARFERAYNSIGSDSIMHKMISGVADFLSPTSAYADEGESSGTDQDRLDKAGITVMPDGTVDLGTIYPWRPPKDLPAGVDLVDGDDIDMAHQRPAIRGTGAIADIRKRRQGTDSLRDESGIPDGFKLVKPEDASLIPQGYKNIGYGFAASFEEGTAGFYSTLNNALNWVSVKIGQDENMTDEEAAQFKLNLFDEGIKNLRADAEKYRNLVKNPDFFQKAVASLGGVIPGAVEFKMGVPYAAMEGYQKDGVKGAFSAVLERIAMGRVLSEAGKFKLAPGAAITATAFGAQEAAHGGSPKDVFQNAFTGALLHFTGGPGGGKTLGEAAGYLKASLPERLQNEQGSINPAGAHAWAAKAIKNAGDTGSAAREDIKRVKENVRDLLGVSGDSRAAAWKIAMFGQRAAEMQRAEFALMEFKSILKSMPKEEQYLQAVHYQEGRLPLVDPRLKPFFDIAKELSDKNWSRINSSDGKYLNYADNYLRQVCKNRDDPAVRGNMKNFFDGQPFDNYLDRAPDGTPRKYIRAVDPQGNVSFQRSTVQAGPPALRAPTTAPAQPPGPARGKTLTGGRGYFKSRTFDSYLEPLMVGLDPKYDNLYDLVIADASEKSHYIAGMRYWNALKKTGDVKFFRYGQQPADWEKIQDPMGRVVTAIPGTDGPKAIIQEAYAPKKVSTVLNNFLSAGLRGNPWYDFYRAVGDPVRKMGVSFSPFHAKVTFNNDVAIGIGESGVKAVGSLFTGDGKTAMSEAGKLAKSLSGFQTVQNMRTAKKATEEFYKPGTHPEYRALVSDYINAGGRLPDPKTMNGLVSAVSSAFKETGKDLGDAHIFKAISDAADATSAPIMQFMVPYAKLMHFALKREAATSDFQKQVAGLPPGTQVSPSTRQLEWLKMTQDIVKFGDSMYGQLAYDNLNLKNSVKDALFFVVKYPGWNLGSGRWIKSNITGAIGGARAAMGGNPPTLFEKQSLKYTAGLLAKTAIFNTILYYALHGKGPEDPKELFSKGVWTGGYNSDGGKEYVRDADYLRDMVGMSTDPWGTVKSKIPYGFAETIQLLDNSDYFGNRIMSDQAHWYKWLYQIPGHYVGGIVPYSIQQATQGTSTAGKYGQFAGLSKAPQRLSRTPLEAKIADYYLRHAERGRSPEDAAQGKSIADVQKTGAAGNMEEFEKGIDKLRKAGNITEKQADNMRKKAAMGAKKYRFSRLPVEDAIDAFAVGSTEEKKALREILEDKWDNARDETRDRLEKAYYEAGGT